MAAKQHASSTKTGGKAQTAQWGWTWELAAMGEDGGGADGAGECDGCASGKGGSVEGGDGGDDVQRGANAP